MHVHARGPDRQLPILAERDVEDLAHQSQHVLARLLDDVELTLWNGAPHDSVSETHQRCGAESALQDCAPRERVWQCDAGVRRRHGMASLSGPGVSDVWREVLCGGEGWLHDPVFISHRPPEPSVRAFEPMWDRA